MPVNTLKTTTTTTTFIVSQNLYLVTQSAVVISNPLLCNQSTDFLDLFSFFCSLFVSFIALFLAHPSPRLSPSSRGVCCCKHKHAHKYFRVCLWIGFFFLPRYNMGLALLHSVRHNWWRNNVALCALLLLDECHALTYIYILYIY